MKQISKLPRGPREKLAKTGLSTLSNSELLAIIISSGQEKSNVLQVAKQLEKKLPLSKLSREIKQNNEQILLKKIQRIKGLAQVKASQILAGLELGRRAFLETQVVPLNTPQQIWQHCHFLRNKKQEYCLAFFLNGRHELISQQTISIGGVNFNFLDGRSIFEAAFNCNASAFVIAHNHPSGAAEASLDDLIMTKKLADLAQAMGLPLLDHLVVTENNYYSIRRNYGELTQLEC